MTPLALRTSAGAVRRALAVVEDGRVVPLRQGVAEHAQVDFRQLGRDLDALEAKSLDALRDALSESRDALVARVRKASDFAALANDLKRLPRYGAVEMEVRAMLDRAREAGRKDLRREVREARRDFADSSFTPKAALRWLRATAFWVAGILGDRVLADVKGIVLNGLKTGTAGSVMAQQIFDAFVPWLGDPDVIRDEEQLQPWRLETIVRTNTTTAYNHGRLSEIIDPEIARFVKGVRYSATLDTRTTEVCRFLDGKVFKPTDPNLEALLPPNHYGCRSLIVAIVAGEQVDAADFITPEEIGKARGLADAKFLTQTAAAWKAYSEWDESAHPRGETTPASTPGSFAPKDGATHDGTRTLTDEQVRQAVIEAGAKSAAMGWGDEVQIDLSSLPLADRLAILEFYEKNGADLWVSSKKYSDKELSAKWDQFQKDSKGLSGTDTLKMGMDRGLFSFKKEGDFTYSASSTYPYRNVLDNLSHPDRDAFERGYVRIFADKNPRGASPMSFQVEELRKAGWGVEELERFSDRLHAAGAKPSTSWNSDGNDYSRGINTQSSRLALFSKDYETFRTGVYSDWSIVSDSSGAAAVRRMSEIAFPAQGIKFYNSERDFNEDVQFSSRAVDNLRKLKAETETFYKAKLKTDDLSTKPLEVMRGVRGHVEAYTPGAAEAWTRDKRTVDRFGKMMSRGDGKYSALKSSVTHADVLWSWESAQGKPGWPADKDLKGKKEVVVLGARVKDVQVEHRIDEAGRRRR